MTQSTPTHTFTIDFKCDTDTLNQLKSQLKNIAEQVDRINGRRYDAGMTLAVEKSAEAIMENAEMIYQVAAGIHMKEAGIPQAVIKDNDDHIRQIVREEIRQFVTRESERGGLFSKW
ncbi:hypothetical protein [Xenorhabdus bovienii]|uniref:hypothetical protein n=1 Tax=Xenorhabdus bovienii TaxID=40576 RepID=UPI0023B33590|nr:hypothetical protein [Xenorhabdus bovienii]MDE9466395.1 hypothetical protein [Xenorhabdus bovienii]MDE9487773.1 hypothetical protein [Xenorhabdus bovienii]